MAKGPYIEDERQPNTMQVFFCCCLICSEFLVVSTSWFYCFQCSGFMVAPLITSRYGSMDLNPLDS